MPKDFNKAFSGNNPEALFIDAWLNDGLVASTQERWTFKDLMSTPDAAVWMPKVVENIIREPVEPRLVLPSLLHTMPYDPRMRYTFPAIGALTAYDVGESEGYREQMLNIAPGSVTIVTGKAGLMFAITEEMAKYSAFPLINMHLRAGRQALDRHKEKKGMDFITGMGVHLFDNVSPTTSVYGTCTGRGITGAGNGSCRMEDLLNAYAAIMMNGFAPDTLLMHPLAWAIWMTDPMLQTIVKNTGQGLWFQRHNMAKSALPWKASSQNGIGIHSGSGPWTPPSNAASQTPSDPNNGGEVDQTLNSPAVIPDYFPYPMRVLVSPFAPFNENNNTCDIIICDSSNVGVLLTEVAPTTDDWTDFHSDRYLVKMKENYGFHILEDGQAIGVLKNVALVPNLVALPVQPSISSSGSLSELDVTTAISGL